MFASRHNPYRDLERALGYRFKRRELLETALTHRSYRYETSDVEMDNQRLEFLGDAALGLAAAAYLYARDPEASEGPLTAARSSMTNGKALAGVGRELDLGLYMRIGKGEEGSGGRTRDSNLADAVESVLGAAYLDGGMRAVGRIFDALFVPRIDHAPGVPEEHNPKGGLQEWVQRERRNGPEYRIVDQCGPAHAREYTVEVAVDGRVLGRGTGSSKRAAESRAAAHALQHVREPVEEDDRSSA